MAIFIDGSNLYSAARALQHDMDFRRMLDWFRERSILTRAYYYTAVVEGEEFSPVKPLVPVISNCPLPFLTSVPVPVRLPV